MKSYIHSDQRLGFPDCELNYDFSSTGFMDVNTYAGLFNNPSISCNFDMIDEAVDDSQDLIHQLGGYVPVESVEPGLLVEVQDRKYLLELPLYDNRATPEDIFRYVLAARLYNDLGWIDLKDRKIRESDEDHNSTGYMVLVSTSPNKIPFESIERFIDEIEMTQVESTPYSRRRLDKFLDVGSDRTIVVDTYNEKMCEVDKLYVSKDDKKAVRSQKGDSYYKHALSKARPGTRHKTAMEVAAIANNIAENDLLALTENSNKYMGVYVITASQTPDYGLLGPMRMYGPKDIEYECHVLMPQYNHLLSDPVDEPMLEIRKNAPDDQGGYVVRVPLADLPLKDPAMLYNTITSVMGGNMMMPMAIAARK